MDKLVVGHERRQKDPFGASLLDLSLCHREELLGKNPSAPFLPQPEVKVLLPHCITLEEGIVFSFDGGRIQCKHMKTVTTSTRRTSEPTLHHHIYEWQDECIYSDSFIRASKCAGVCFVRAEMVSR